MIEHLIDFSFLKSLYLAYIKIPMPFFIPFASFLMIFLFFVRQNRKRSFCLCVFSRLSFSKAFFFFSFFFFRLIVLSYYAASIKISLIPFIGILLFFLDFLTTFSSLIDILKYLYFHHFLILAPDVGCDLSQGYLTNKKTSF